MEQEDDLAESTSKTYRLIGRNLLLFQQMEQLLKIILPYATVSISSDTDIDTLRADRYAKIEKVTLGQLVNRYIDEIYDLKDPIPAEDPNQLTIHSGIRWTFKDPADRDACSKRLRDLVASRNDLIHHLLRKIDITSTESWISLHGDLEDQQRRVRSEIKKLKHICRMMKEAATKLAHPETQRKMVYDSSRIQLVYHLRAAAGESSDPDGWTGLKSACKRDPLLSTEIIPKLREHHETTTLTALLETLGGFELRHEKNDKGRAQTFYRPTEPQNPPSVFPLPDSKS